MKQCSVIILACALAIPAMAQDANTTNSAAAATAHAAGQMFLASAATMTAPLVFTNDYLHLESEMADVAAGGKAVFHFSITNAGDYQIESVVNAPDDSSNSFFVNIDASPTDPDMIWDIDVTDGFEKRLVNWRGDGDSSNGQFVPKTFKLGAGNHTLILVGREPDARLKSLTIFPAPPAKPATP